MVEEAVEFLDRVVEAFQGLRQVVLGISNAAERRVKLVDQFTHALRRARAVPWRSRASPPARRRAARPSHRPWPASPAGTWPSASIAASSSPAAAAICDREVTSSAKRSRRCSSCSMTGCRSAVATSVSVKPAGRSDGAFAKATSASDRSAVSPSARVGVEVAQHFVDLDRPHRLGHRDGAAVAEELAGRTAGADLDVHVVQRALGPQHVLGVAVDLLVVVDPTAQAGLRRPWRPSRTGCHRPRRRRCGLPGPCPARRPAPGRSWRTPSTGSPTAG